MESKNLNKYSIILMWSAIFMVILDFSFDIDAQKTVWAMLTISSVFHVGSLILKKLEDISDNQ